MAVTPRADARFVAVAIDAAPERVYAFAADPANIPRWAPNLGRAVRRAGEGWIVETADGPGELRFVEPNSLGVLDHWVRLASGATFYNPMRVVANGAGSLLAFTLVRQPGWSDARLDADAALVRADLDRLKALLEDGRPAH
jgi:uncharacterized protein YndB with AHSA1/START domain